MGSRIDFLNLCDFIFTSKDHRQESAQTELQALKGVWWPLAGACPQTKLTPPAQEASLTSTPSCQG